MLRTPSSITASVTYKEFLTDKYHLYYDIENGDVVFHRLNSRDFFLVKHDDIKTSNVYFFEGTKPGTITGHAATALDIFCIKNKRDDRKMTLL